MPDPREVGGFFPLVGAPLVAIAAQTANYYRTRELLPKGQAVRGSTASGSSP
jgi:hypothetical protein